MLLCGAPLGHFPVPTYFRDWQVSVSSTNGSSMLALMHPNFWQISEGRDAADDHTITLAWDRTGLCVQLRRVTARKTLDAPLLTVLLTKVHLGTKEFSFDFHTRDLLWTNITQRVSAAAQWMVVGSLETSDHNIALRGAGAAADYAVTSSPQNHLRCIASGLHLAAIRFSTFCQQEFFQEQILVLEIADLRSRSVTPPAGERTEAAASLPGSSTSATPPGAKRSIASLDANPKKRSRTASTSVPPPGAKRLTLQDQRSCFFASSLHSRRQRRTAARAFAGAKSKDNVVGGRWLHDSSCVHA